MTRRCAVHGRDDCRERRCAIDKANGRWVEGEAPGRSELVVGRVAFGNAGADAEEREERSPRVPAPSAVHAERSSARDAATEERRERVPRVPEGRDMVEFRTLLIELRGLVDALRGLVRPSRERVTPEKKKADAAVRKQRWRSKQGR